MQTRKMSTDYLAHDLTYRELRAKGFAGWGGETYATRMNDWDISISELRTNPDFPPPGSRVLELGCGAGDVSLKLAEAGYQVSGIDISPTAIEWAEEKFRASGWPGLFVAGNACDLSAFAESSLAAVVDGNCLHCVIGETDRTALLAEVRRVLIPGGVFFVSSMVGEPRNLPSNTSFDEGSRCQIRNDLAYRYISEEKTLLNEIRSSGFEIVSQAKSSNLHWDHLRLLARKI